jgi:hypothetical protein
MVRLLLQLFKTPGLKVAKNIRKHWAILFLLALSAASKSCIYVENNIHDFRCSSFVTETWSGDNNMQQGRKQIGIQISTPKDKA